jgi:hypothetical protein
MPMLKMSLIMTNEPEKKRRKFVYQRRRDEQNRQRLRILQFDKDIINAHRGDTEGLRDYLFSDLPLSQDQREQIADLIHRRIERRQRGRPRGRTPIPNPAREAREAESEIVYEVRQLKLRMYGDKPVPRGKLKQLIDQVCEDKAEKFEGVKEFSIDNIRRELKRGAKRKAKAKVKA